MNNSQICFILFHGKKQLTTPKQTSSTPALTRRVCQSSSLATVQVQVSVLSWTILPGTAIAVPSARAVPNGESNTDLAIQSVSERYLFKEEFDICHCTEQKWQGLIRRVLQWWCVRGGHELLCASKKQLQTQFPSHTKTATSQGSAQQLCSGSSCWEQETRCREDPQGHSWRCTLGRRLSMTKEQGHPWRTVTQPVGYPHRGRDTLKGLWSADDSQQGRGPPVRRENQLAETFTHVTPTFLMSHPLPAWRNRDRRSVAAHSEHKGSGN